MDEINKEVLPERKRKLLFEILILIVIWTILYIIQYMTLLTYLIAIFLTVVFFLFRSYINNQQQEIKVKIIKQTSKPEEYRHSE